MQKKTDDLAIIVMESSDGFGEKVDKQLSKIRNTKENFVIPIKEVHFSSGEGKVVLDKSVRNKDIYILTDVSNYSVTYKMRNFENHTSPKDHFMDIISLISAIRSHAKSVTVIMPLLYSSRQHKRKGRESSDCALALQLLQHLGVKCIITFDAHDPSIQNAVPLLPFENFYATKSIVLKMAEEKLVDFNNLLIISPDTGAMDRARFYAEILQTDVGMFYKRRDVSKIVDGRNPIVAHEYLGENVEGKDIIIVDDMISSGDSMIEVAYLLKEMKAKNIYLSATFSLFDHGLDRFNEAYEKGIFKKLYTSNLIYLPEETNKLKWITKADCSEYLAAIIDTLNKGDSISPLIYDKKEVFDVLENIK